MPLCVDCLKRENPGWLRRYRMGSVALMAYGAIVFLLTESLTALVLQGLFFLIVFPWILWPLLAASRPPTFP
jgi:hypothetical protein